VIACRVPFGVGMLISAAFHLHPVWAPGLRPAVTVFVVAVGAVAVRYAVDSRLERTAYDGNDRSRMLPISMRLRGPHR
jgi:predicted anti-sigma-YlaC factor YlaD